MDSKDRKLCLNREEVEDLRDGLLISAVGKHDAVKASAREQLAHLEVQAKTGSAVIREGMCVLCACVRLKAQQFFTCVITDLGSVWLIRSATTETSSGSSGRRGGRSCWSETWRVWPMTTPTVRPGGFWEATGTIIWESRSKIQPTTPIIP